MQLRSTSSQGHVPFIMAIKIQANPTSNAYCGGSTSSHWKSLVWWGSTLLCRHRTNISVGSLTASITWGLAFLCMLTIHCDWDSFALFGWCPRNLLEKISAWHLHGDVLVLSNKSAMANLVSPWETSSGPSTPPRSWCLLSEVGRHIWKRSQVGVKMSALFMVW